MHKEEEIKMKFMRREEEFGVLGDNRGRSCIVSQGNWEKGFVLFRELIRKDCFCCCMK